MGPYFGTRGTATNPHTLTHTTPHTTFDYDLVDMRVDAPSLLSLLLFAPWPRPAWPMFVAMFVVAVARGTVRVRGGRARNGVVPGVPGVVHGAVTMTAMVRAVPRRTLPDLAGAARAAGLAGVPRRVLVVHRRDVLVVHRDVGCGGARSLQ